MRAPVPWHLDVLEMKENIEKNLYITNPVMLELLKIYHDQFSGTKIIDMSLFAENMIPTSVEQFQSILKSQCQAFKTKMLNE